MRVVVSVSGWETNKANQDHVPYLYFFPPLTRLPKCHQQISFIFILTNLIIPPVHKTNLNTRLTFLGFGVFCYSVFTVTWQWLFMAAILTNLMKWSAGSWIGWVLGFSCLFPAKSSFRYCSVYSYCHFFPNTNIASDGPECEKQNDEHVRWWKASCVPTKPCSLPISSPGVGQEKEKIKPYD